MLIHNNNDFTDTDNDSTQTNSTFLPNLQLVTCCNTHVDSSYNESFEFVVLNFDITVSIFNIEDENFHNN